MNDYSKVPTNTSIETIRQFIVDQLQGIRTGLESEFSEKIQSVVGVDNGISELIESSQLVVKKFSAISEALTRQAKVIDSLSLRLARLEAVGKDVQEEQTVQVEITSLDFPDDGRADDWFWIMFDTLLPFGMIAYENDPATGQHTKVRELTKLQREHLTAAKEREAKKDRIWYKARFPVNRSEAETPEEEAWKVIPADYRPF